MEEARDHGIEFGDGHGVLKQEVRDYERKGARGRQDVEEGHGSRDVADDPGWELRFWDEHRHWEDDAEEGERVEW